MIGPAEERDLEQVARIEAQAFSQPWTLENFKEAYANPAAVILVDREDESVAGYLVLYVSPDEGEVTNVAVSSEYRRQGIGRRLVEAAQTELAARNGRIVLEVRVSNAPAIALYRELGFQSLGIRKGFYEKPKEDAMIMAWEKNRC